MKTHLKNYTIYTIVQFHLSVLILSSAITAQQEQPRIACIKQQSALTGADQDMQGSAHLALSVTNAPQSNDDIQAPDAYRCYVYFPSPQHPAACINPRAAGSLPTRQKQFSYPGARKGTRCYFDESNAPFFSILEQKNKSGAKSQLSISELPNARVFTNWISAKDYLKNGNTPATTDNQ